MNIAYVIDTHVHADHYSGGRRLAELPIACTKVTPAALSSTFLPLTEGLVLDVGNWKVKVLHTPGHTPDSVACW